MNLTVKDHIIYNLEHKLKESVAKSHEKDIKISKLNEEMELLKLTVAKQLDMILSRD